MLRKFLTISTCMASFLLTFHSTHLLGQTSTADKKESEKVENKLSTTEILTTIESFDQDLKKIKNSSKNLLDAQDFKKEIKDLEEKFKTSISNINFNQKLINQGRFKLNNHLESIKPSITLSKNIKDKFLLFVANVEKTEAKIESKILKAQNILKEYSQDQIIQNQKSQINNFISTLKKIKKDISTREKEVNSAYNDLKKISNRIKLAENTLEKALKSLQTFVFDLTRPSLFENKFWEGAGKELRNDFKNIKDNLFDKNDFDSQENWIDYIIIFCCFCLFYFVGYYFKLKLHFENQAWAFSGFLTICLSLYFIQSLSILFKTIMWIFIPITLYSLVRTNKKYKNISSLLLKLFIAYALIRVIEILNISLFSYRIILTTLSLAITIMAILNIIKLKKSEEKNLLKRALFFSLALSFSITTLAESIGYHALAVYLVHGIIQSAFLIFFFLFVVQFSTNTFAVILKIPSLSKLESIQRHRYQILTNLKKIIKFSFAYILIATIPVIWGNQLSLQQSFNKINQYGIELFGQQITLGMLLEALIYFLVAKLAVTIILSILNTEVYPRKQIDRGVANSFNSLIKYSLWSFFILFVFMNLGFQVKQLAFIAGALSVGIGFGLQNIINNFVSGIIMLFERPVKVGDLLEIDGNWGEVEKVGLRSTIIRTFSKTQLIIPNSDFITSTVTNLTLSDSDYRITVSVGVAYGSDTTKVKTILKEVAVQHPKIMKEPEPIIIFREFGDSSLNFEIFAWTKNIVERVIIASDIMYEVDQRFREADIEIPFPQRDLHLKSIDPKVIQQTQNNKKAPTQKVEAQNNKN